MGKPKHGHRPRPRPLAEADFLQRLVEGRYKRIVVLTGAGVSTAAGIMDFRSKGGMFERIRATWAARFPALHAQPEALLSVWFRDANPEVWEAEVAPWLCGMKMGEDAHPTAAHMLCGWLHRQGWLRRVYTQNVDGLHTHPAVGLPPDKVVECHGAMRDASVVLYGADLPATFYTRCQEDFGGEGRQPPAGDGPDLVLVMGTSLQVAPFCALPNLAPPGCTRVLVTRDVHHCLRNEWSAGRGGELDGCYGGGGGMKPVSWTRLAGRRVTLRPRWLDLPADERLLVDGDCEGFVARIFECPQARAVGMQLSAPPAGAGGGAEKELLARYDGGEKELLARYELCLDCASVDEHTSRCEAAGRPPPP